VVSDADKNLYVQLSEPFGSDMIRKAPVERRGIRPGAEVVARLNRVLGVYGWEWLITARWTSGEIGTPETGVYPAWVMVEGVLSINDTFDPPRSVKVSGVGGQQVKMLSNGKGPVDLGDEWKGAATDALKKACMHRGVALDLARKEEALAAELAMSAVPSDPVVIAWIGAAFAGMPEAESRARQMGLQRNIRCSGRPDETAGRGRYPVRGVRYRRSLGHPRRGPCTGPQSRIVAATAPTARPLRRKRWRHYGRPWKRYRLPLRKLSTNGRRT
jgi:hypothetical protein